MRNCSVQRQNHAPVNSLFVAQLLKLVSDQNKNALHHFVLELRLNVQSKIEQKELNHIYLFSNSFQNQKVAQNRAHNSEHIYVEPNDPTNKPTSNKGIYQNTAYQNVSALDTSTETNLQRTPRPNDTADVNAQMQEVDKQTCTNYVRKKLRCYCTYFIALFFLR